MDAYAIRDKQGNPVVDDGYLSFICEESNNIIRVDPNQFDFNGPEPYPVEHGGIKYKLYLYKTSEGMECEANNIDLDYHCVQKGDNTGSEIVSVKEVVEGDKTKPGTMGEQVWNEENSEVLMNLYKEFGDSASFTIYPQLQIWEKISEELQSRGFPFSPLQVENRIKVFEEERKMDLNQPQKLKLKKIKQHLQVKKPLKNMRTDVLKTDKNVVSPAHNTTVNSEIKKEPFSDVELKDNIEIEGSEDKVVHCTEEPPLCIDEDMEVDTQDHTSEPSFNINNKLVDFKAVYQGRKKVEWNEETTEFLTDLYQKYSPELGKVGKFTSKAQLWYKISEDFKSQGYSFTPIQVQSRWRNLISKPNNVKEDSQKSSKSPENGKAINQIPNDFSSNTLTDSLIKNEKENSDSEIQQTQEPKPTSNKDTTKAIWSEEQAELLIDVYKEITLKHNLLKFGSKKHLWKIVAEELKSRGQNFTPQQVHSKWKSLERSLRTKLERIKKNKLHQSTLSTCDSFPSDYIVPTLKKGRSFRQLGAKPPALPLEVILQDSSEDESESPSQNFNVLGSDYMKLISESINKFVSIKENYYRDRLSFKVKKLKAFEERTAEIRKTNNILNQFLNKS